MTEEEINLLGLLTENRNFLTMILAGKSFRALLDTGAVLSIVGSRVAECVQERFQPSDIVVRAVIGKVGSVLGALNVHLKIDSIVRKIQVKAVLELEQDIILGMAFCKSFNVEIKTGEGMWKVNVGGRNMHSLSRAMKGKRPFMPNLQALAY